MVPIYRKAISGVVWHFSPDSSTGPKLTTSNRKVLNRPKMENYAQNAGLSGRLGTENAGLLSMARNAALI
jgi:hypothetical protein